MATTNVRNAGASAQESARNYARQGWNSFSSNVEEHPTSTVLIAFGIGFGISVAVANALSDPPRKSHWYDMQTAEKFGRQVLDSLSGALPDALSSRMGR